MINRYTIERCLWRLKGAPYPPEFLANLGTGGLCYQSGARWALRAPCYPKLTAIKSGATTTFSIGSV